MSISFLNPIYFGIAASIMGLWLIFKAVTGNNISLENIWSSHNKIKVRQEASEDSGDSSWEIKAHNLMRSLGYKFEKNDLNLAEISPSRQAFLKIRTALIGVVASFGGVYFFRFLGIVGDSNWWLLPAVSISGAVGFILPDRKVREIAAKRRETMRSALSAYLDLVKILLAGGSHSDGALFQAASIGRGWAFGKLKATIDWSRVNGQPVPLGFQRLAQETGVQEIEELAAITALADKEGANLSETLSRRAELLAVKDLAEASARSHAVAERMSLPTVIIAISFVAFIAYPALASLTTMSS